MEIVSHSLAETAALAERVVVELGKRERGGKATVVNLIGDLGSGKTTFTQAVARTLGISERVTSPTFVIMKKYQGLTLPGAKESPWDNLTHIDCYRLDKSDDLLHLGWNEIVADKNNLILVEWPERIGDLLSSPTLKIKFEVLSETSRKIIYS